MFLGRLFTCQDHERSDIKVVGFNKKRCRGRAWDRSCSVLKARPVQWQLEAKGPGTCLQWYQKVEWVGAIPGSQVGFWQEWSWAIVGVVDRGPSNSRRSVCYKANEDGRSLPWGRLYQEDSIDSRREANGIRAVWDLESLNHPSG